MSDPSGTHATSLTSKRLLIAALLALSVGAALTLLYPRLVLHGAPSPVLDTVGAGAWLAGLGVPLLAVGAVLYRLAR